MSSPAKRQAEMYVRVTGGGQASITITGEGRDYAVFDEDGDEVGHVDRFGPAARMLFRHYGLDRTHAMRTTREKG